MNKHFGSNFNDFLAEEGLLEDSEAEAVKRVLSWQIMEYLEEHDMNKTTFAEKMKTSRSQLDRLLDPHNTSVNLKTLVTAAKAMGKKLHLNISD